MPSTEEILALAIAIAFACGLNLSAVVLTLGLLSQADVLTLPGPIAVVGEWWVIATSAALFLVESFADKVPAFDVIWNALMTFIRVPAGAVLAYAASDSLGPGAQISMAVAGGAATFAANGAKLALRGGAAASPEPFSNFGLSLIDDVAAIGLTWFAVEHPYVAAAIVVVLIVAAVVVIGWIIGALRSLFRAASRQLAGEPVRPVERLP
jgi:hypothetical protein